METSRTKLKSFQHSWKNINELGNWTLLKLIPIYVFFSCFFMKYIFFITNMVLLTIKKINQCS
jgi:hypothetical protein